MDMLNPALKLRKRRRLRWSVATAVVIVALLVVLLLRLGPALPRADRSSLWIDTVQRGDMLREVRATGTLVPRTSRWLAAATEAQAQSDYASAKVKADADAKAVAEHLIPEVRFEQEQIALAQLQNRMRIERERVKAFGGSMQAQLDAVKAKLPQQQSNLQLRQRQADALQLKAGIAGVLQEVAAQEGGVSLSAREGVPGVVAQLWLPLLLSQEPVGDELLP